jgi:hypothetical protein
MFEMVDNPLRLQESNRKNRMIVGTGTINAAGAGIETTHTTRIGSVIDAQDEGAVMHMSRIVTPRRATLWEDAEDGGVLSILAGIGTTESSNDLAADPPTSRRSNEPPAVKLTSNPLYSSAALTTRSNRLYSSADASVDAAPAPAPAPTPASSADLTPVPAGLQLPETAAYLEPSATQRATYDALKAAEGTQLNGGVEYAEAVDPAHAVSDYRTADEVRVQTQSLDGVDASALYAEAVDPTQTVVDYRTVGKDSIEDAAEYVAILDAVTPIAAIPGTSYENVNTNDDGTYETMASCAYGPNPGVVHDDGTYEVLTSGTNGPNPGVLRDDGTYEAIEGPTYETISTNNSTNTTSFSAGFHRKPSVRLGGSQGEGTSA